MNEIVRIDYAHTGRSSQVNELGMREMQAKAYEHRDARYLLIKAPPASGKSRALMFIALDKLHRQGIKRVVVAVPERSIGGSFGDTALKASGFPYDWQVAPYYNLCIGAASGKAERFAEFMRQKSAPILVCAHATLRNAMERLDSSVWDDCLLAIDEFHHTSADADSGLGEVVRRVMRESTGHIVAMTGSYFRGDGVPVLRPEDEELFTPVTYNYYQQLSGYKHLRRLRLGYHFYQGRYLDHIAEVLDTHRKTIIHIPSVNARSSTGDKYAEVEQIIALIGERVGSDPQTGVQEVRTPDGRVLRIADLVEDNADKRDRLQRYLQRKLRREELDIIIALGTAKEGFDWEWCEMCLTVGVRGSLTEVIQIIGRCTRDSEGKEEALFVNMIAKPNSEEDEVKVAVNDFLKAITASLLMEQVMAPNWSFKTTKAPEVDPSDSLSIVVEGLKPLSSDSTRRIVSEQLDDLVATIMQSDLAVRAVSGTLSPETINRKEIPQIIRERYPALSDTEVEEVAQYTKLRLNLTGRTVVDINGIPLSTEGSEEEKPSNEGKRFLQLTNRMINLDELSINLVDTLNPFRDAYEIISKQIDTRTLSVIQDTISAQKYDMPIEEAQRLFPECKAYIAEHGHEPSSSAPEYNVRRLAAALAVLRTQYRRRQLGLDYQPN